VNPKYPIYVISKGRWESRQTARALLARKVPFRVVVEPQEFEQYAAVLPRELLLQLPFSNLGQGSIPARNWVWQHSIGEGHARHWILDDNIKAFFRFNKNLKVPTADGTAFKAIEDFTDRYTNVPMAGMNYFMFAPRKSGSIKPITINTRVYSCILLQNDRPHRWRGRYNEDTDLSLRFLKDGYCTLLFNAFLAEKSPTMTMKGGNTDELYKQNAQMDGRLLMAQSLQKQHPDVTKIVWKWDRWQHHVDYSRFKTNGLILKPDAQVAHGIDEYGMKLRAKANGREAGSGALADG